MALIYRTTLGVCTLPLDGQPTTSFELILAQLKSKKGCRPIALALIYRPPSSSVTTFVQEVSTLLDRFIHFDIVMCGDFNCPGVQKGEIYFRLAQMASDNNIILHVTSKTHDGGIC